MQSILHGDENLRIYTAAVTPTGLSTAAEIADGVFPIWMDPERFDLIGPHLQTGFAKAAQKNGQQRMLADFDVAPFVPVALGDDLDACRAPVRAHLALYIGGMGPRQKNFYTDYVRRMGYEPEAEQIQTLYLAGRKDEAAAAVPDRLVDAIALVGPAARIRERLAVWKAAGARGEIASMLLARASVDALRLVAEELL
jgi:alkanesulfonate monooxygenase SsuD/methylene tetrahydromethanopterin reductase-like flavin-dependent oxidoreductase (luciferase family)